MRDCASAHSSARFLRQVSIFSASKRRLISEPSRSLPRQKEGMFAADDEKKRVAKRLTLVAFAEAATAEKEQFNMPMLNLRTSAGRRQQGGGA